MAKDLSKHRPVQPDVPPNPELIPTPRIGDWVYYYYKGDANTKPVAAVVTDTEMPGRVKLTGFTALGGMIHITNCWYAHLPEPQQGEQKRTIERHGAWGYRDINPPKRDYEWHKQILQEQYEAREKARLDAERRAKEKADREKAAAEAAAEPELATV